MEVTQYDGPEAEVIKNLENMEVRGRKAAGRNGGEAGNG